MHVWIVALVVAAGCAKPHVNLAPLPPNPTPQERVQIFSALHAVGEETEYTTTCRHGGGCSTTMQKTLQLANGIRVHHPEDLLPVVADTSGTARSVHAMKAARSKQLRYGLLAGGSFLAFALIGFHGLSSTSYDGSMDAGHKLLMIAAAAGVIVGAIGAYKYHFRANALWADANEQFNESLAQRLNICTNGLAVVPCEGGAPGAAPAVVEPDPALKSLRQK